MRTYLITHHSLLVTRYPLLVTQSGIETQSTPTRKHRVKMSVGWA
jgi:hypothetical protein